MVSHYNLVYQQYQNAIVAEELDKVMAVGQFIILSDPFSRMTETPSKCTHSSNSWFLTFTPYLCEC
jgi:hypothetical protein